MRRKNTPTPRAGSQPAAGTFTEAKVTPKDMAAHRWRGKSKAERSAHAKAIAEARWSDMSAADKAIATAKARKAALKRRRRKKK